MEKTKNLKETQAFAKEFAQKILIRQSADKKSRKGALVVALSGDLGSGKTSFTQGFAKALGVKEPVLSPTFIIERIHEIKKKPFTHFIHVDAYRLENAKELLKLGWEEVIKDPNNIVIVEWAEKVKEALPKDAEWLHFKYVDEKVRHIQHGKKRK